MSTPDDRPSEVALFVCALLPTLPARTVQDLQALLAQRLTFVGAAQAREARLGLLLDLVAVSDGELPATEDYEEERRRRRADGEQWPTAGLLSRAFNGWDRACRAAMRLHFRGAAGVSRKQRRGEREAPYPREEMLAAIVRFHVAHDQRWPSYTEFFVWRRDLRRRAELAGAPPPRIPEPNQYRGTFPNFMAAVAAARRVHEMRTESDSSA